MKKTFVAILLCCLLAMLLMANVPPAQAETKLDARVLECHNNVKVNTETCEKITISATYVGNKHKTNKVIVYVDGNKVGEKTGLYGEKSVSVNVTVSATPGTHKVVVEGWESGLFGIVWTRKAKTGPVDAVVKECYQACDETLPPVYGEWSTWELQGDTWVRSRSVTVYDARNPQHVCSTDTEYDRKPAVPGCTDQSAMNFDPAAEYDDGSCYYLCDQTDGPFPGPWSTWVLVEPQWKRSRDLTWFDSVDTQFVCNTDVEWDYRDVVYGCMDPAAVNFDPAAEIDDGSCYLVCSQTGDPVYGEWTEWELDGTQWKRSRTVTYFDSQDPQHECSSETEWDYKPAVPGCIDDAALNYDPAAEYDDGSCIYGSYKKHQTNECDELGVHRVINLYEGPLGVPPTLVGTLYNVRTPYTDIFNPAEVVPEVTVTIPPGYGGGTYTFAAQTEPENCYDACDVTVPDVQSPVWGPWSSWTYNPLNDLEERFRVGTQTTLNFDSRQTDYLCSEDVKPLEATEDREPDYALEVSMLKDCDGWEYVLDFTSGGKLKVDGSLSGKWNDIYGPEKSPAPKITVVWPSGYTLYASPDRIEKDKGCIECKDEILYWMTAYVDFDAPPGYWAGPFDKGPGVCLVVHAEGQIPSAERITVLCSLCEDQVEGGYVYTVDKGFMTAAVVKRTCNGKVSYWFGPYRWDDAILGYNVDGTRGPGCDPAVDGCADWIRDNWHLEPSKFRPIPL